MSQNTRFVALLFCLKDCGCGFFLTNIKSDHLLHTIATNITTIKVTTYLMFLSPWCIVVKRAGATAGEVWRREGARPPSTMQWGKHLILSGLSSIKEVFHFNRNIIVYLRSPSENFVDHPSFNTNKQCIPNLKGIIHLFIQLLTRKAKCDGAMVCWKWCLSRAAAKKLDK